MTIEEAKEVIEQDIPCEHDADLIEALHMAIASLEAWEAVRQEAKQEIESNWGFERIGEENILAIIDKHWQEVKND